VLKNNTRNRKNKKTARRFRREMSVSERVVWEMLRRDGIGFRFRRQFAIGPYFLDFYCPEARICVEVDGEQHLTTKARDAKRDEFLATKGILTMRIPSLEFFDHDTVVSEEFVEDLRRQCEDRSHRADWDRESRKH